MKRQLLKVGRWAVPGLAFTAIVMAASSGEDGTSGMHSAQLQGKAVSYSQPVAESFDVELDRLNRPQAKTGIGNAFGVYVPPRPPQQRVQLPPPLPPPDVTAPPLPFTYLGRYEDAPSQLAFLVRGERILSVAVGDVIDNTYRIERVTPSTVELLYLPLNIKQTLGTGGVL